VQEAKQFQGFLSQNKDVEMSLNPRASGRACGTILQAELLEDRQLLSGGASLPASAAISFASEFFTASAQAGTASILLQNNLSPGADGLPTASPQQAYLSYGGGTAVPGVDYVPGGQTVSFSAGQSSDTIQLPLLPGSPSEGTRVVELELSTAPGGQPFAAAYLDITHNSDTTPPTVIATKALTKGPEVTAFVITFSKAMAPGPIQNVNDYAIEDPRSIRPIRGAEWSVATRLLPLKSAAYDPTSHSVTLTLQKPTRKYPYFMIMDRQSFDMTNDAVAIAQEKTHSSPSPLLPQISPITDTTGNPLDSTHSGTPDGSLVAIVGVGKAGAKFVASLNQSAASMQTNQ
jgi:hypothetical protein